MGDLAGETDSSGLLKCIVVAGATGEVPGTNGGQDGDAVTDTNGSVMCKSY